MGSTTASIPVWLDCDPGHDDAFAILLAAYHPSLELLGISTVHGNAPLAHTTQNAGSILTAIGKPSIPVYAGAAEGLVRSAVHAGSIHGESGLDGTELLPAPAVPAITDVSAIDAMAKALSATASGTAWLIATGALTNIAALFTAHPSLASHVKGLSIMGGAIGDNFTPAPLGLVGDQARFGNWTPYAEFNIVVDPEAAALLFENQMLAEKTVLIPLDVTHLVLATADVQDLMLYGPNGAASIDAQPSTLRVMLVELLTFFAKTYADVFGITAGPPLHDPLAVAVILDGIIGVEVPFRDYLVTAASERGPRERFHVKVITEGTHEEALQGLTQTGRTVATLLEQGRAGVKIPRGLDVGRFWTMLEESLQRADAANAAAAV